MDSNKLELITDCQLNRIGRWGGEGRLWVMGPGWFEGPVGGGSSKLAVCWDGGGCPGSAGFGCGINGFAINF